MSSLQSKEVIYARNDLPLPNYADIKRPVEKSDSVFISASISLRYIDDEFARDPDTRLKISLGDDTMLPGYTVLDNSRQGCSSKP